jgi:hypothetical protein
MKSIASINFYFDDEFDYFDKSIIEHNKYIAFDNCFECNGVKLVSLNTIYFCDGKHVKFIPRKYIDLIRHPDSKSIKRINELSLKWNHDVLYYETYLNRNSKYPIDIKYGDKLDYVPINIKYDDYILCPYQIALEIILSCAIIDAKLNAFIDFINEKIKKVNNYIEIESKQPKYIIALIEILKDFVNNYCPNNIKALFNYLHKDDNIIVDKFSVIDMDMIDNLYSIKDHYKKILDDMLK